MIQLLIPAVLSASALASSFYEQPFPETVKSSSSIVRGKIGKSSTEWATFPDGSKHLFTYYDVEVKEGLKGVPRAGSPIRIRELGGSKDGVSLQVSGTAHFETGEDVVVMLGESNAQVDGAYPVQGMMMGKYTLEKGTDGKELLRGPGLGSSTHPGLRNNAEGKSAVVSLDQLRDIVRTQASAPAVAKSSPTTAVPASNSLLSASATTGVGVPKEIHDENLMPPPPVQTLRFRPALLIFGALIGILWFLKSRRKRR